MNKVAIDPYTEFPSDEGELNQIYGHIGGGKTYLSTAMAIDDLEHGKIVYTNWKLDWNGYDERKNFLDLFRGVLGMKKEFCVFPKENYRYLDVSDNSFYSVFERLTDCVIYLDEGQWVYDSYVMTKMDKAQRMAILSTRHFNRKVYVITQRPTAIHVTVRGNVNRFYKTEKIFDFLGIRIFRKTEFQDMTADEKPDEEKPIKSEWYFARKKIYQAYNSKYMRGDMPISQPHWGEVWFLEWQERWKKFKEKIPKWKKKTN